MAGKSSEGFTKAAQKQKFIRNRDIKLTNGELKKEASIQRLMCEGVCDRCREKVQWRFRYDKYKPLKTPGTCADCKQKKWLIHLFLKYPMVIQINQIRNMNLLMNQNKILF